MSRIERQWPSDAFDAIGILAVDGEFEIEGTDGDRVELEARLEKRMERDLPLEPAGRWLQFQVWERQGDAQYTLRLPKKKAWVVDLSAARGEVQVKGIQARLRVMMGKGEVKIKDCRGIFNFASGKGEVEMERCVEAEMPERPPLPQPQFQSAHMPGPPPMPESPPMPGDPDVGGAFHVRFRRGPGMRYRMKPDVSWDWFGFDSQDWAEWGAQFGEQARTWAQQFAGHFVGAVDWLPEKTGIGIRIGKGDAKLQEIEAGSCALRLANGDVELKGGRIEDLEVEVGHGGIECESVMPAGDWDVQVRNGDIRVALPSNTQARFDVATRHGDIDSQVPLVRVGRPGPESRYGGRMVGTIGQAEGNVAQVSLTAVRGDIEIRLRAESSRFAGERPPVTPAQETKAPASSPPPASSAEPSFEGAAATEGVKQEPVAEPDKPEVKPDAGPAQEGSREEQKYGSQLSILQALSAGEITVEEAEKLLRGKARPSGERKNVWGSVRSLFGKID